MQMCGYIDIETLKLVVAGKCKKTCDNYNTNDCPYLLENLTDDDLVAAVDLYEEECC